MEANTNIRRRKAAAKPSRNGQRAAKPSKNGAVSILDSLGITAEQAEKWTTVAAIPQDVIDAYCKSVSEQDEGELTTEGLLQFARRQHGGMPEKVMEFFQGMADDLLAEATAKTSKLNLGGQAPLNGNGRKTRRTKQEMQALADAVVELLENMNPPATVRQVFYQATVAGLVPKDEKRGYKVIQKLLVKLRREGRIPYSWITDATRWMRKPTSHNSFESLLSHTAQLYRRDFWERQDTYCEVWIEKDALAGVILPVTRTWDVPLMVARGFSSLSYLYSAAEAIKAAGKKTYIYHLGDFDPSGVCAARTIERELRHFAPEAEIHFERLAVTPQQIKAWKLPTRPTKSTDSRAGSFGKVSVELDAIPPDNLRQLVDEAIEQHVDQNALNRLKLVEDGERDVLRKLAAIGFDDLEEFAGTYTYGEGGDDE